MIELRPATNPLETPSPRPSEIVRNWPQEMWGTGAMKGEFSDGHVRFCALGIMYESAGGEWGGGDANNLLFPGEIRHWDRYEDLKLLFPQLTPDKLRRLYRVNDDCGKDAAADDGGPVAPDD